MKLKYFVSSLVVLVLSVGVLFAQEYDTSTLNNNGFANYRHAMSINSDGYPIITYQDQGDLNKTKVTQWDGSSTWNFLGSSSLPSVASAHHDIDVGPDGYPVVVYIDTDNSNKLSVIKRDGSTRNFMGNQWITSSGVAMLDDITYVHIKVGSDNNPVLEYPESGTLNTYAMRWNGTNWDSLGKVSSGIGETRFQTLALNDSDIPYVAYVDNTISEVVVREYSGGIWSDFGPHITGSNLEGVIIDINSSGDIFAFVMDNLGFRSYGLLSSTDGSSWTSLGDVINSSFLTIQGMAIYEDGYPIVSYQDSYTTLVGETQTVVNYSSISRWNGSEWVVIRHELLNSSSQPIAINDLGQIYVSQGGGNTYLINPFFRSYFGLDNSIYWENLYNPLLTSLEATNGPASLIKGVPIIFTVEVPSYFNGETVLSPWGTVVRAEKNTSTKIIYNVIGYKTARDVSVALE